ncbi:MAG: sigma-70 family RNA polymerase sigma factor [Bryobacteraceae bacterium]
MKTQESATVTGLLARWRLGEQECLNQLVPLVHDELHRIARRHMRREAPGHTLQTTALINEAYLRLVEQSHPVWQDRTHFFAIAARVMRHILSDHARGLQRHKRGGNVCLLPLDEELVFAPARPAELIALDEALDRLAAFDPRKAQVVELRYFGGMNVEETAAVLGLSANTVIRDWGLAKVWLKRELLAKAADAG